jgi:hypothetical protein
MYVCLCLCMHVHLCAHALVCACARVCACNCVRARACVRVRAYVRVRVCACVHACLCASACACACAASVCGRGGTAAHPCRAGRSLLTVTDRRLPRSPFRRRNYERSPAARPTLSTGPSCRQTSMVASAGDTDRDLAATQFTKNCVTYQYYRVLNIMNLKLYHVYNVVSCFIIVH